MSINVLADICQAMESAITDISLEYEWRIPSPTPEEIEQVKNVVGPERMAITKDGYQKCRLSVAFPISGSDANSTQLSSTGRILFEESLTLVNMDGSAKNRVIKVSCNGKVAKQLQITGSAGTGGISTRQTYLNLAPPLILTPLGFSVVRCRLSSFYDYKPLSVLLRQSGRVDAATHQVNGFNTIRADLLRESSDQVWMRIYFSVDHGYTPVRYEHTRGCSKPEDFRVAGVIDIKSLEQVAQGLWFPSSGVISNVDEPNQTQAYKTIGKTLVNQGLSDEYFDIDFPAGTKVYDETRGVRYTVGVEQSDDK